ncbi:MAG: hypothetical protein ACRYF0_14285 [Janthinobacterium lividum]
MLFRLVLVSLATLAARSTTELRDLRSVYETNEPAFFREHRVREIRVYQQLFDGPKAPLPRRLDYILQFDQQGRQVQYQRGEGSTAQRVDAAYNAAGALSSLSRWAPAPGGATAAQPAWQPTTRELLPEPNGALGYLDQWDAYHQNWLRMEDRTCRRWQAHDTTYLLTTYRPGPLPQAMSPEPLHTRSVLKRSYEMPGGITRLDVLTLEDQVLQDEEYHYVRRQGLTEESGLLFYESRPPATSHLPDTHPALNYLRDSLARRTLGKPVVEFRTTYDANGRVRTRDGLTYERDARGRLMATMHHSTRYGTYDGTRYEYLPNGLVANQKSVSDLGFASVIYYYTYRYY